MYAFSSEFPAIGQQQYIWGWEWCAWVRNVCGCLATAVAMRGCEKKGNPMNTRPGMEIRTKPDGGFIFLSVPQLLLPWWAHQQRLINWFAVRVWFAAHEVQARRCQVSQGVTPTYTPREVARLVGDATNPRIHRAVTQALEQLAAIGLLQFSETAIRFASRIEELSTIEDTTSYMPMLAQIKNNRRRVPVPRRTIRFMAAGAKRSVVGTMLGHLLRCLYYVHAADHGGECRSWGRIKAQWIADVFGLCIRSVYEARHFLIAHGWLIALDASQREWNGGGLTAVVSLTWQCDAASTKQIVTNEQNLAGPDEENPPQLAGPFLDKKPLQEQEDHKPENTDNNTTACGAHNKPGDTGHTKPGCAGHDGRLLHAPKQSLPTSLLGGGKITKEQLENTESLLALFAEAQDKGLAKDQLRFFAMAERAKNRGTTNPGGFFYQLVKRQLVHFLTEEELEAAKTKAVEETDDEAVITH